MSICGYCRPAGVERWDAAFTVGPLEGTAVLDELRKEHHGLFLIGSIYRGIGIGDCVKSGFDAAAAIAAL